MIFNVTELDHALAKLQDQINEHYDECKNFHPEDATCFNLDIFFLNNLELKIEEYLNGNIDYSFLRKE